MPVTTLFSSLKFSDDSDEKTDEMFKKFTKPSYGIFQKANCFVKPSYPPMVFQSNSKILRNYIVINNILII